MNCIPQIDDSFKLNLKTDAMASLVIHPFSGAILAGGRSLRMGADKAGLWIDGETLLARQVRLLRAAGASEVMLNQHPQRMRPLASLPPELRLVGDDPAYPDAGPLAGLAAVLAAAREDWVAVVAVDLPCLTVGWWRKLLAIAEPGGGAVGRRTEGTFEPLAAIYPRRAQTAVRERLHRGDYALQPLIRTGIEEGWMRPFPMSAADVDELHNWNAPEDRGPRGLSSP